MEIIKFIKALDDDKPKNIRKKIYNKNIKSAYAGDGRMIFYLDKNQRFSNKLVKNTNLWLECNGIIIDMNTLKPVVIPPLSYKTNINTDIVNKFLNENLYDIYFTEDGTVINLYFWDNSWRISTNRNYDVTNIRWGEKTYREILNELVPKNFFELLNKNHCYTLGFTHSSMHKFQPNNNKIWFIQSVNLDTYNVIETSNIDGIENQSRFKLEENSVKHLFKKLTRALQNYINYNEILYGFILKSRNPTQTGIHSNILLESTLMQKIRMLLYSSQYNNVASVECYDRELYTILYSFLDPNQNGIFIKLFPQYKTQFNEFVNITDDLTRQIIAHSHNIKKASGNALLINTDLLKSFDIQLIGNFHNQHKLIASFVQQTKFIHIFYDEIYKKNLNDSKKNLNDSKKNLNDSKKK